jgi:hypothetical protein
LPGRSRGLWRNLSRSYRYSFALLLALAVVPAALANSAKGAADTKSGASVSAAASATRAEALNPLEVQLRDQFPSIALDSHGTIEAAQEFVAGQPISGMRARQTQPQPLARSAGQPLPVAPALPSSGPGEQASALRVFYPGSYDESFVAEVGGQRVALRAVGAHFAQAAVSGGKLFFTSPHDSVDVIEVPGAGRSEELLVLHDARAHGSSNTRSSKCVAWAE